MINWIDMTFTPHVEDSDDGILLFEFKAKTGIFYYVVADLKHNDDKGDRRDVFYDTNSPTCPLQYSRLIRYLSTRELYHGFSFRDAKVSMNN